MAGQDWLPYARELARVLERANCLKPAWLREALFEVPRHLFIDQYFEARGAECELVVVSQPPTDAHLRVIYSDVPLMIREPPNSSSSSQPEIVLAMLKDLEPEPGHKVLEIGTGTGWNTALLAYRVGDDSLVYSVEIQPELVEAAKEHLRVAGFRGANVRAGDGGYGWVEAAPFDRIIVTVGSPDVPRYWIEQLSDEGILLLPLEVAGIGNPVLRLRKAGRQVKGEFTRWSVFYPFLGNFSRGGEREVGTCSKSMIDELLRSESKAISLRMPLNDDFLFFLHISKSPLVRSEWYTSLGNAVFDPQSRSVCFVRDGQPVIHVCGDPKPAERLANKQEEWSDLGCPNITDYKVELVDSCTHNPKRGQWTYERPSVTLKLSLSTG